MIFSSTKFRQAVFVKIVLAAGFMISSLAIADGSGVNVYGDGRYGSAGCGLGSLIFGPKPGVVQVLAATVNHTSGSQTFGITTGTSNCGKGLFQAEQVGFVTSNLASIEREAAAGHGDTLVAFATTLGCPLGKLERFESALQGSYREVFSERDSIEVLTATSRLIHRDEELSSACSKI